MTLNIVIPYYRLMFFKATLNSLASQIDKRFKVYIGNDASDEDPKELLKTFEGQFDFSYHRFDENIGNDSLVKQWDRCIKLCDNDCSWIMILGDDDVLGDKVVEKFYEKIETVNALDINVIKFSTVVIDENDKEITNIFKNEEISKAIDTFYNKIVDKSRSSLSEHIFRKSSFQEKGFKEYGLAWHSDDMAWLEFSNFKNMFCINTEKVCIRVSNKSISGTNKFFIEKEKASFQFYKILVQEHLFKFRFSQRNLILRKHESKSVLVNGKSLMNYFRITWLYAKNAYLFSVLKFTYRFIFKYNRF